MKCRCCNKLDLVFDYGPVIPYPLPCDNLFLSHTIPSPIDQNDAKRSISDIVGRLSRLEKYTKQLGALARELKAEQRRCAEERSILDKALLEYQSVVTPIRMIPDDVLREIFVAVADSEVTYEQKSAQVVSTALAGVCRRWRAVSISTPRLWTHLAKIRSLVETANLMRIFTNRSGVYPMQIRLGIHIAFPEGWGEGEEKMMLVNAIAKSAGRWQTLEIDCSRGCLVQLQRVLHAPSQLFETLESLSIAMDDGNAEPLSIFACAPRLKRVAFKGPSALGLALPWGQIENLTLVVSPSSMQFLVATLAQCHNLVHGHFGRHTGRTYDDDDAIQASSDLTPVRNNMQSCKFRVRTQGLFRAFFDGLELPLLSILHIDASLSEDTWSHSSFSRFLHRSKCTLRKLVLELGKLSTPALLQVLASVPSLEEFEYYHGILNRYGGPDSDREAPTLDNDVLQQLTHTTSPGLCPTGSSLLLPNLRTLKLMDVQFRIDLDAFTVMLMSRTALPPARRLNHLHLYHHNTGEVKILESALAGADLKVHMHHKIHYDY